MNIPFIKSRFTFSRPNQIRLFLMLAFPINFWALLLWFRDIEFITERTNFNDAIGVGGYVMLFALVEAIIIYLVVNLLLFILSGRFTEDVVLNQTIAAYLILSLWLMFEQALHLFEWQFESIPWRIQYHLDNLTRFGWLAWILMLAGMIASVVLVHRYGGLRNLMSTAIERISLLSGLYLILNLAGIVIVVIRNL